MNDEWPLPEEEPLTPLNWIPEPPGLDEARQNQPKPELRLRFGRDALHPEPLGTVVRGLLHTSSVSLIYGPPKSGKSFLATDLFLSIAAKDQEWMGHTIVRPGPVLYVACEGHAGFWKRLQAAAQTRCWDHASFPAGFILATGRPMLIRADPHGSSYAPDPSSITTALETAQECGLNPVAIAIDTVFRSFGAGNVNASPDMNVYLASVAALTDQGYAVALVHHEIKAGGTPAGSVSLLGGSDTIIHIWRDEDDAKGRRFWQVEMAKDDAETDPRAFSLQILHLGFDLDGQPATSCVVRDDGAAPDAAKKRGRPPSGASENAVLASLIYKELTNLLADPSEGQDICIHALSPPIRAVGRSRLRATINQAGILDALPEGKDRKKTENSNDKQVQRGNRGRTPGSGVLAGYAR